VGRLVAVKKAKFCFEHQGMPASLLREISVLRYISNSRSIVDLLRVFYLKVKSSRRLLMVFEYLNMDLRRLLVRVVGRLNKNIEEKGEVRYGRLCIARKHKLIGSFNRQILQGIVYCHTRGVIHRDLKPQNVLVSVVSYRNDSFILKIADFGLARLFHPNFSEYTREVLTLWYRAPEVLLGSTNYDFGVDVWSAGCILYELHEVVPLFKGNCEAHVLSLIFLGVGSPSGDCWPGLACLSNWHEFPDVKNGYLSRMLLDLARSLRLLLKHLLVK
jgi:serine/threonine protein kinase